MPSSLPSVTKTWQHSLNGIVTAQGTQDLNCRATLRAMKNAMKAMPLVPWTVVGSSNGVASWSISDGTDRWSVNGDMPASSWLILKQTGVASNFQVLFWRINTWGWWLYISPSAGFTGGGATTRPTATDELAWQNSGGGAHSTDQRHLINVSQSSDGACTRVWIRAGSKNVVGMLIETLKNPVSGLTIPWVAWCATAGATDVFSATAGNLFSSNTWKGYHSVALTYEPTYETAPSGALYSLAAGKIANEVSGNYFMSPMGVLSTTSPYRGRHGDLFDVWLGSSDIADGDTYPGAAESPLYQFQQVGTLILPNDLTAPTLS